MPVRVVATDLDGTLLREQLEVSPRVAGAIRDVQSAGILVVFVTARNWRSVELIARSAGVTGLAICSNGAVVYDLSARTIVASHYMDRSALSTVMAACREAAPGVSFMWETPHQVYREASFTAASPPLSSVYIDALQVAIEVAADHEVTKVLVGHPGLEAAELLHRLAAPVGGRLTATISGPYYLELAAPGVTKATSLAAVCERVGVDREDVVAIGDQPNDLPMLSWAGRPVAMANAHPDVLRAVPEHTATNLDDGVALVLESLLAPAPPPHRRSGRRWTTSRTELT